MPRAGKLGLWMKETMESYFAYQCQPNQQYPFAFGTEVAPKPAGLVLEFHDQPANRNLVEIIGLTPQQLGQLKKLLKNAPQRP
jgi:hypothetical protein